MGGFRLGLLLCILAPQVEYLQGRYHYHGYPRQSLKTSTDVNIHSFLILLTLSLLLT
ncbi:uncharacterized protein BX663DRAFT_491557 [Cokeromyces recurvatus]|uniref:uncharacterized protein n=1 Tax=Cokeromyces recurvatus TaxID=90255 RepID=UPI00222128CC|nr:uncharacterized protein BX663DRAFT_491557 [Cokeromyces recurvatus]KAI7907646.1 hypothetical protein BX663DRAFT_491557 [Cokeromyces recurvatus]